MPISQLREHGAELGVAEAELAQGGGHLREHVQGCGLLDVSVVSTIGMAEANGRGGIALDEESTSVHGTMVC